MSWKRQLGNFVLTLRRRGGNSSPVLLQEERPFLKVRDTLLIIRTSVLASSSAIKLGSVFPHVQWVHGMCGREHLKIAP
jgi:hypothetical protein